MNTVWLGKTSPSPGRPSGRLVVDNAAAPHEPVQFTGALVAAPVGAASVVVPSGQGEKLV
jgi:hypothetical protein